MKNEGKDSMKIFEPRLVMTLMDYSIMMHHCSDYKNFRFAIIGMKIWKSQSLRIIRQFALIFFHL